ncbi:MAG: biofilm regulation diguanylate cyclase SiaD [Pseudomonadota bacterium]
MTGVSGPTQREDELLEAVTRVLADPAYDDDPLRGLLADLFELSTHQRERMERLVRLSDGFQDVYRAHNETLATSYDRHLRRLERLVRISDRYQENLRELNESLREAALKDPLTGLGNRRYLLERLNEEMDRRNRRGTSLGVAILDIDRFKAVNDTFGHEVGDQLLCAIAEAIRDSLREYDICGRWGGEEFLLVFPEADGRQAAEVCERIRSAISATASRAVAEGERARITASVGLVEVVDGEEAMEAINRADSLLLAAKDAGRDRLLMGGEVLAVG